MNTPILSSYSDFKSKTKNLGDWQGHLRVFVHPRGGLVPGGFPRYNGIQSYYKQRYAMRTTRQISITLPNDMADMVKSKVQTGEYASESEVIRDGLRRMMVCDRVVENWLREQVAPAYDALKADPSRAVTVDQVRARLAAEHDKDL
jgi:putative addiction module CopG family antidote